PHGLQGSFGEQKGEPPILEADLRRNPLFHGVRESAELGIKSLDIPLDKEVQIGLALLSEIRRIETCVLSLSILGYRHACGTERLYALVIAIYGLAGIVDDALLAASGPKNDS